MTSWKYYNPVQIEFGAGRLAQLTELCEFRRAVLVTTKGFSRRGITERITKMMGERLVGVWDVVKPNPDLEGVRAAANAIRKDGPDGLIALGGGSVIDTAKIVARQLQEPKDALPVIAIPTTAGTGAEVTPFATVWDFDEHKKHSVMGDDLFPRLALLDPDLSLSSPASLTASSGLDAVSHALESTWNHNASPASLALSAKSLSMSLPALKALSDAPDDLAARSAMLAASTIAGIAIAQTRTALAHSISYPLTAHFGVDHGAACSFALVELLRFNNGGDDGRLEALARAVGLGSVNKLAEELSELLYTLNVAGMLINCGVTLGGLIELSGEMFTPGRAENNLCRASVSDVKSLLEDACQRLGVPS